MCAYLGKYDLYTSSSADLTLEDDNENGGSAANDGDDDDTDTLDTGVSKNFHIIIIL